jgi:hypothetical protein
MPSRCCCPFRCSERWRRPRAWSPFSRSRLTGLDLRAVADGLSPQSTSMIRPQRSPHCMQQKQADKHRRAVPAEAERTAVAADVERTQNPKVRGAPL